MDGKYSKVLTILLIVAIVAILLILLFLGVRIIRNNVVKSDYEGGADTFIETAKNNNKNNNKNTNTSTTNSVNETGVEPVLGVENLLVNNTIVDGNSSGKKQTYKGFPQVGVIEIPTTKLKCPILEDASKSAIEVAVAVYDGVGLNKVGNTTIVGHNYRNGTFFSDNKKIAVGDKIYITDETGNKVTYIVYNTVTTSPEDSSYFERDTEGAREITLDTCTDDTQSRFLVLAKEE
ncbi:MAG: sortase [Clostridia bacterium]|nr:sortase [Clostridia bacterium]